MPHDDASEAPAEVDPDHPREWLEFADPADPKTTDDSDATIVTFVELVPARLVVQRVAFETEEPKDFLDLVMELRETQSSKYTVRDTPIFTCVQQPMENILDQLF